MHTAGNIISISIFWCLFGDDLITILPILHKNIFMKEIHLNEFKKMIL